MKKIKYILLIFTILIICMGPELKVYAAEEVTESTTANPTAELIPSIENLYDSYKDNKYFTKYEGNYYLDLEDTGVFSGLGGKVFNMIANLIFGLQVILTQMLIVIVYYTFELSFFDIFKAPLELIIGNLKESIFNEFVLLGISLIGIFYIIKIIKNQRTQIWTAILQTLVILVIALSFFRAPTAILGGIDSLSKGIGQAALEGTYKATNDGNKSSSGTEAISTNLWIMFVHKPWQIYEFGNTKFAEANEEKILTLTPESKERQKIVDEIAKDKVHFQSYLGLSRFGLSLIYLVIYLILAFVILLLCFLLLGYQFLMMLYALFAPIVFVLALIPNFGLSTVKSWAGKVIGYGSMKAILSLIIAVIFSFMISAFELSDKYGLLVVALIQVVLLGIVWFKRDSIIDGFFQFTSAVKQPSPQNINKIIRQDNNLENGVRTWTKGLFSKNNSDDYSDADLDLKKNGKNNKDNDSEDDKDLKKNRKYNSNGPQSNNNENIDTNLNTDKDDNIDSGINTITNNLNELRKIAEEILEKRYNESKSEAEEKAELLGKDPEYSAWTKKVMNREAMNQPKFEEREKQAVINQIEEVQAMGGDFKDFDQLDQDNEKFIKRPKNIEPPKKILEVVNNEKKTVSNIEASIEFTDKFNEEFGKNHSQNFMESLVDSYSQDEVNSVITDMIRIKSEKEIKNPTGYLLAALKKNKSQNQEVNPITLDLSGYEGEDEKKE